jgi:hypothetical protein
MSLPGNPALDFRGSLTVWKLVGSKELADSAEAIMRNLGVQVDVFTEEETEEQIAERERLLSGVLE